jgi:hypothetical protein
MPDKSNSGRAEVGFPPMMMPFSMEAFMELNRPTFAAMAQVNGKVYENLAAMNQNWADFLNRRLKEDLGMPKQLAACKSVQEMYTVCADFFQTAMADYQTEFEQISKLGRSLADETLQAMQARAEEAARQKRAAPN